MIRSVENDPDTLWSIVTTCVQDTDEKLMEESNDSLRLVYENADQSAFLAGAYYDVL